jgi:hypothetical protein
VFSSSADPAARRHASRYERPARAGRIGGFIRISMLVTVIAVRPRWRWLLAGTVLTVLGAIDRQGTVGLVMIPGLLLLWQALLTPGGTDADRERRAPLKRELAAFSTPAQRCDLEATLDRYPNGVTEEIRAIFVSQAAAWRNNGMPGAGPR